MTPDVTELLRTRMWQTPCTVPLATAAIEIDLLREQLAEAGYQLEAQDEMIMRAPIGKRDAADI